MTTNRIAIFLGGYLPAKKYGGPVTSISNLVDNLGDSWEFYIISNDHDLDDNTRLAGIHEGWNQVGKAKVLYIKDKDYNKANFVKILEEVQPNVVYLSSVFFYQMNVPAIKAAKSLRIPVILAPRGELCEGALNIGRGKKELYLSAVKLSGLFHSLYYHVTSDEEEAAVCKIFAPDDSHIVQLPNMPCAVIRKQKAQKEQGHISLVYLSRIVEKKNLLFAIQAVNQCRKDVSLNIYGPLESTDYWEKCREEIDKAPDNVHISYMGAVEPGKSREIFAAHDAFIFPTFSENYGHVIVEAITSGCPIIVSRGTTPWDDIDQNGGYAVPLTEAAAWTKAVDSLAEMPAEEYEKITDCLAKYVKHKLALNELKEKYNDMFKTSIERGV